MGFLNMARNAGLAYKKQAKFNLSQLVKTTDHNADLQASVLTNASRGDAVSSLLANPAESNVIEQWDLLEQIKDRVTGTVHMVLDKTVKDIVTPALAQYGTRGTVMVDALKLLPGVSMELALVLAQLGPLRTSGIKLDRISEAWAVTAKYFSMQTATTIRHEAPMVSQHAGATLYREAPLDLVRADLSAVIVKDEIHRVADAFNLDAKTLLAIIQAAAVIQSNEKIELAAGVSPGVGSSLDLSIAGGVDSRTSTSTKQSSAISHTIAAGVSATISAPVLNLNPVTPATPDLPVALVAPVVLADAGEDVRPAEKMPQYTGQNGHGTVII